jgi:hypothetical protein
MAILTTAMGSNSAVIEWSNTTPAIMNAEIRTFLEAHGWVAYDAATWTTGSWTDIMTYRSLCADGVTYKYMQVRYHANLFIACFVYETYDSGTKIGTNLAFYSDNLTYQCAFTPTGTGSLVIFATNRYFFLKNPYSLSYYMVGCVETTKVDASNDRPPWAWISGHYFQGTAATYYYSLSPVRTYSQTGDPAAQQTRLTCAIGAWGYGTAFNLGAISLTGTFPFDGKHQVHDVIATYDVSPRYLQGKLYGIKVLNANIGNEGDIVTAKCDASGFLDPAGTNKDFYITVTPNAYKIGLPL